MSKISKLEEYRNRTYFKGSNIKEYTKNKTIESIDDLINRSQYGFAVTIGGTEYSIAIMAIYGAQEYGLAQVISHLGVLATGTVFQREEEIWLVVREQFRATQPGFSGEAVRTNTSLRWVDKDGFFQHQPGFVRMGRDRNSASVSDESRLSFSNIMMRDENAHMVIATPSNDQLKIDQRFIVKKQAYRIMNIDRISIEDVDILSLSLDKLIDSDDVENGIADNSTYTIMPSFIAPLEIGVDVVVDNLFIVLKDGEKVEEEYAIELDKLDPEVVKKHGTTGVKGVGFGQQSISAVLMKNPFVRSTVDVEVAAIVPPVLENIYISGPDYIAWNSVAVYELSNESDADFVIVANTKVKHSIITTDTTLSITIEDRYTGSFEITATDTLSGEQFTKTIRIKTV